MTTKFEGNNNEILEEDGKPSKTNCEKRDLVDDTHYQNQKHFCAQKEWIAFKYTQFPYKGPFLIKELLRLVPYKDDGHYIKFHVFNMPGVTIKAVEFVGTVMEIRQKEENKYMIFNVSDGTACITVVFNMVKYEQTLKTRREIDEKHKRLMKVAVAKKSWLQNASNEEAFPSIAHSFGPPFEYPKEIPRHYKLKLIHNWWTETHGGMLGKKLAVGDYVFVDGFCSLDFDNMKKPTGQIEVEHLSGAKFICNATSVQLITEKQYNNRLQHYIETFVTRRYKC